MSRFVIYTVYLLCSGLNNENERQSAPLTKTRFLLLEHRLQPTPSPLCGLASWPLLDAFSAFPGE